MGENSCSYDPFSYDQAPIWSLQVNWHSTSYFALSFFAILIVRKDSVWNCWTTDTDSYRLLWDDGAFLVRLSWVSHVTTTIDTHTSREKHTHTYTHTHIRIYIFIYILVSLVVLLHPVDPSGMAALTIGHFPTTLLGILFADYICILSQSHIITCITITSLPSKFLV